MPVPTSTRTPTWSAYVFVKKKYQENLKSNLREIINFPQEKNKFEVQLVQVPFKGYNRQRKKIFFSNGSFGFIKLN